MNENSYFWFEITSMVVLTGILLGDLLIIFKRPHVPGTKESALWITFYAALAGAFGLVLWWLFGATKARVFRRLANGIQPQYR
jgi:tellurite resistance protein TerC